MKKLALLLLVLTLVFACAAAEEIAPALTGGWTMYQENPCEIPEEVLEGFNKAFEGLTGCSYEPVALLASQVVNGTNYCLLCKSAYVIPNAEYFYTIVYINIAFDGSAGILDIQSFEPGLSAAE